MENKEVIKLLLERDFEKLYQQEISIYDLSYIENDLFIAEADEDRKKMNTLYKALAIVPEYLKYYEAREAGLEDLDFSLECQERAEAEFEV